MNDLTITFNRPVDKPTIHFAGIGGNGSNFGISSQFQLISINGSATAPAANTATWVSGNSTFAINTAQNLIYNSATSMSSSNDASGSALINASGVTSLTFKVLMKGFGSSTNSSWSGGGTESGDALTISLSVPISYVVIANDDTYSGGNAGTAVLQPVYLPMINLTVLQPQHPM